MLMFTLLLLFLRKDSNLMYWNSELVRSLFQEDFHYIYDDNTVYSFLNYTLGPALLIDETSGEVPQLRKLSDIVMPIR